MPATDIFGTGAPQAADANLIAQVAMGVALLLGAHLARHKRFVAHGICQAAVMLLNLVAIGALMWPSLRDQVLPPLSGQFLQPYYFVALVHGLLGSAAELLGLYIVFAAGGQTLYPKLGFRLPLQPWKLWMRVELALWWSALLFGIATYFVWYVGS